MRNELDATELCLRALMDDELRTRQLEALPYVLSHTKDEFGGAYEWRFVMGPRYSKPEERFHLTISADMTRSDRIKPPVTVEFCATYMTTVFFDDASIAEMLLFISETLREFVYRPGNQRAISQWIEANTPERRINR